MIQIISYSWLVSALCVCVTLQCLSYAFENVTSRTISCPVDVIDIYSEPTFWHEYVDLPHCFTNEVDYDILPDKLPANGTVISHIV